MNRALASKIGLIVRLGALAVYSWVLPEAAWRPIGRAVTAVRFKIPPRQRLLRKARRRRRMMRWVLGRPLTRVEATESDYNVGTKGSFDDTLRVLRSYRPDGWHPRFSLSGREHVDAGLERGRGVLLWISVFRGSRLVTKMALAAAGYEVHHLSRPDHGFSKSRLGVRHLNRHWARIENRFLAERIVLEDGNMIQVMKRLRALLDENRIVSITDAVSSSQLLSLPFLEGRRRFATGPANLALRTGAALLPVYCLEKGPSDFEVVIGDNLAEPSPELDMRTIIARYGESLGEIVSRYPHLWVGW